MTRPFIILLSFLSIYFISCKENTTEGMFEDKIGFLNSGEQLISAYIANTEINFESPVYKSGIGTGRADVQASLDEATLEEYNLAKDTDYEMMPADCYTITNSGFVLNKDAKNGVVKIKIDVKKLEQLQGVMNQKYVIALKLSVNGDIVLNDSKSSMILIPEITGGIRPNSEKVLWNKTFAEMGINNDHNSGSFAVTSKYLFVNARSGDLKYFDRFTGDYIASIPLSFKGNLTNFTVTADSKDNLLITNFRNAAAGSNSLQTIYRIKGTAAPAKYIEIAHIYQTGRKLSITGDLDQDAIITSTNQASSRVLYWLVKNGVLVSQTPQIYTADATRITWGDVADAVAVGPNLEKGLFIAGHGTKSNLGFFSGSGGSIAEYDLLGGGLDPASFRTQSLSYATFNGASYLAVASQKSTTEMHTILMDVTKPSNLKLDPNSQKLIAYRAPSMTTLNNANFTADTHLRVSDDLSTIVLYSLGTNGSISAVQFDSETP